MKGHLLLFGIILLLSACKKDDSEIDFGFDYFPLEEGHFVEYDVKLIFHDKNLNPQHDTTHFRLKTVIGENYIDNLGRTAKKLYRYSYDIQTGDLLDQRVWSTLIDEQKRGEVVEENQRKIRLVFAVNEDKKWDVNAYNTEDEEIVYYSKIGAPKTINGIYMEETTEVFYDNFFSLVDYRKIDRKSVV